MSDLPTSAELRHDMREELASARATIAELEAERDEARHQYARVELQALEYHNRMQDAIAERDEALREHTDMMWQRWRDAIAERQRREDCEAALRLQLDESVSGLDAENAAEAYFSRYPSESDNRTKVAG